MPSPCPVCVGLGCARTPLPAASPVSWDGGKEGAHWPGAPRAGLSVSPVGGVRLLCRGFPLLLVPRPTHVQGPACGPPSLPVPWLARSLPFSHALCSPSVSSPGLSRTARSSAFSVHRPLVFPSPPLLLPPAPLPASVVDPHARTGTHRREGTVRAPPFPALSGARVHARSRTKEREREARKK
ncbi:hypothetical protein H696_00599 [Fonticula alba]|uniref:Uncharacterized protein n=1 Tax=Fonticula alba TaxID=691883 RepID=A0A058ZHS3_FONAL|nr:hypothetical protein H696_00599 [Fonticula alba]KCV73052.1 hypothetical protein H696_00599 [Fonticula alba]|eukprot:XP_009492753.1 hypothetical protein H696_00599 [Fonticula alba]